jgi:glycosyltransferase involved in cell wall biosynthesis
MNKEGVNLSDNGHPVLFVVALSLMESGLSGGDVRLRAMMQRLQKHARIVVFTSPAGKRNMAEWGVDADYVISWRFPEKLRQSSDVFAQLGSYWSLVTIRTKVPQVPEPDIIYVQTDFSFEVKLGVRLKKRFPDSRLVILSHHSYREIYEHTGQLHHLIFEKMQEYSFKLMAKYADRVMILPTVTGDMEFEDMVKAGVPESRISRMWNGVDLDVIESVGDEDKRYDACVIGLRKNKGLEDVAGIWADVCKRRPESVLYIIGGMAKSDRAWLVRESKTAGIGGNIVFGGHFSPPQLYSEIKKARICIAPTHQEPYGIAICEAMACGLPVVGYDLENYRRLHSGIVEIVSCFDRSEFARKVVDFLNHAEKCLKLGQKARTHSRAFDNNRIAQDEWEVIKDAHEDVRDEIL